MIFLSLSNLLVDAPKVSLLERSLSSDETDWPEFSHTQYSSWDRCQKAWHYGYALGWTPKEQHEGFLVGTIVHDMAEKVYDPVEVRSAEEVLQQYVKEFMEIAPAYTVELNRAFGVVWRYFKEYVPIEDRGHKILAVEEYFRVPMKTKKNRNFYLHGYIDVVSQYEGKALYTWDHKSSEGNNRFWTEREARMDSQTSTYGLAKRIQGTPVHRTIINMFNTYFYKNGIADVEPEKLFGRITTLRTDIEITNFSREFCRVVDEMIDNGNNPRRSLRKECGRCAFNEPCITELKGLKSQPVLLQKYKQKDPR